MTSEEMRSERKIFFLVAHLVGSGAKICSLEVLILKFANFLVDFPVDLANNLNCTLPNVRFSLWESIGVKRNHLYLMA